MNAKEFTTELDKVRVAFEGLLGALVTMEHKTMTALNGNVCSVETLLHKLERATIKTQAAFEYAVCGDETKAAKLIRVQAKYKEIIAEFEASGMTKEEITNLLNK